jgi:archaellum component FlaC
MEMALTELWSAGLSLVAGILAYVLKSHADEQKRLQILINRTREELAKDYVTKSEMNADINRVMDRLDALDAKIDRLIETRS